MNSIMEPKFAPPAAVLWDMDGTLVDTAELHFQAWVKLAAELNKPFSRADFAATFGWRNAEIIPMVFGACSEQQVQDLGDRKELHYRQQARHGVSLLPGVGRLLENLHAEGFRQAIGSSAPRENLKLILELTATDRFFAGVIAMEDTTRGKPDPEVFLRAAALAGAAPARSVVMEDAPAGIRAARAGGMRAVAVTFVGHHDPETLREAGADLVVGSLEEVSVETIRRLLGPA
jgi:beta-phosphoglucomutase